MNKVRDYNDFLFDSLLEGVSDGTMPFLFSEHFLVILERIEHPIAHKIMNSENENKPITFIDVTEENDKVSFATSPKIIEFLSGYYNKEKEDVKLKDFIIFNKRNGQELWTKYRSTMKVGRLVKKIFGTEFVDSGKPGEDIESFVNAYKSSFDKDNITNLFQIVSGDDIVYWYNRDNYGIGSDGSELYNSCMADEECGDYIKFYAKNEKIRMLILFEDDEKERIVGRALVWSLDMPEGRIFMDRIYTMHDHQEQFFINYAKKEGWLHKYVQTYGLEKITDTKTDVSTWMTLEINNIKLNRFYPYLDTLQYLDQDEKILCSDDVFPIRLNGTDGEPSECGWSDKYKRWINLYDFFSTGYVECELATDNWEDVNKIRKKEDAVYIKYYKEWIPKELYDKEIITTTIGDEVEILKDDAIHLIYYKGWASRKYVNKEFKYSKNDDEWYRKEDVVISKRDGILLKEDAVKVYTDISKQETDWIPKRGKKFRTYEDEKGDLILNKL